MIIVSKFNKQANWWRIFSLLISKWAFSMQIEIIYIYLATSRMIFLDFVFRRYKWSKVEFCWKKTAFCPVKIFCEKRDGHSKRERKKIIALHLKRVFVGTATNFSNNGFFSAKRQITGHVTRQKYQFYFKMFRTLKTELFATCTCKSVVTKTWNDLKPPKTQGSRLTVATH